MDCASCGHRNRDGARFCAACAAPLSPAVACPACGASQPEGARFCDRCGAALADAPGRPWPAPCPRGRAQAGDGPVRRRPRLDGARRAARRRGVAAGHGPLLLHPLRRRAPLRGHGRQVHRRRRHGGLRGARWPTRTTRGARAWRRSGCSRSWPPTRRSCAPKGLELGVRMGLNSGEVVVGAIGEDGGTAWTALGHPVGLAQRMEQLAAPGAIYLTERTAALVAGHVALRDLGEREVKGVRGPLRVHELMGLGPGARAARRRAGARLHPLRRTRGRAAHARARLRAGVRRGRAGGRGRRRGRGREEPALPRVPRAPARGGDARPARRGPAPHPAPAPAAGRAAAARVLRDRATGTPSGSRATASSTGWPRSTRASRTTCRCSSTCSRCRTPSGLRPGWTPTHGSGGSSR